MLIDLYGLRIVVSGPATVAEESGHDLLWQQHEAERLEEHHPPAFFRTTAADGVWIHHAYGLPGETRCTFAISPDGRRVISQALPSVAEADLLALFAEPVMRSVLRARRLVSFHGAALERSGEAILLLGAKGAGKSTLAAMLLQRGWSLLTDDLVRVRPSEGRWVVTPGFRQLKLSPSTTALLGFDTSNLERRWSAPEAPDDPVSNKLVISPQSASHVDVRLRAIYLVAERSRDRDAPRLEPMAPVERLHALLSHVSEDPISPDAPPPREAMAAAAAMLPSVDVKSLSLPEGRFRELNLQAL